MEMVKYRARLVVVSAAALALATACQEQGGAELDDSSPYAAFQEAFDTGADCPELFELRNRMDPDDPLIEDMNEDLQSVECYSSTSQRSG